MRTLVIAAALWFGSSAEAAPLTDVVDVAAGATHACAVTRAGAVVCWGNNDQGEAAGMAPRAERIVPTQVPGVSDAIAVSAGMLGTCALVKTGKVTCWGEDWYAGRGLGTWGSGLLPPAFVTGLEDATQVSVGSGHACALRKDGTAVCWGEGRNGELGNGSTSGWSTTPVVVKGLTNAVQLASGGMATCARLANGTVVCWGYETGTTGYGRIRLAPTLIDKLDDAIDLESGGYHLCALRKTGRVACWGAGALGSVHNSLVPIDVGLAGVKTIAAGGPRACAIQTSGEVSCWGPPLGIDLSVVDAPPVRVAGSSDAVQIAIGGRSMCARRTGGTVSCWGDNDHGELGIETPQVRSTAVAVAGVTGARGATLARAGGCALGAGGVRCWTRGGTPKLVPGVRGATRVAAGGGHVCALVRGGAVACWSADPSNDPPAGEATDWGEVAGKLERGQRLVAGDSAACVIDDGTLRCFGTPAYGGAPLTQVVDVAMTRSTVCAQTRDKKVRCWGGDYQHPEVEIKRGDVVTSPPRDTSPIEVTAFAGARQLGARFDQLCVLLDTTVECAYVTKTHVDVGRDVVQLAVGAEHACVRHASGTVACWGDNKRGQLGRGTLDDQPHETPAPVKGITSAIELVAGDYTTCAVLRGGAIHCWGDNGRGQTGDGSTGFQRAPGAAVVAPR